MQEVRWLGTCASPLVVGLVDADLWALGLGVLFEKLHQGVKENRQILAIARMRAEAEEAYSSHLSNIVPSAEKVANGFSRDEGATVRKVRYPIFQLR